MENLTEIDRRILWSVAVGHKFPLQCITQEQYKASMSHLADLELVNYVSDIGGYILDAIITYKGYYVLSVEKSQKEKNC